MCQRHVYIHRVKFGEKEKRLKAVDGYKITLQENSKILTDLVTD